MRDLAHALPLVQYAIPGFIVAIGIEYSVARWILKRKVHRLNDSINSMSHGLMSISIGFLVGYLWSTRTTYQSIWTRTQAWTLPYDNVFVHVLALLFADLSFYFWHYVMHRVSVIWAAHQVHHSSQEFNLTTALRQASFEGIFVGWLRFLPAALLLPPNLLFTYASAVTVGQFWFHTRLISRLPGWVEFFLNTPSHHRVHHARNPCYLDKNFGGVLIIWDRIFGTFAQERDDEPVVFGTTSPPTSWNPMYANLFGYAAIARTARTAPTITRTLATPLMPPAYNPAGGEFAAPDVDADVAKATLYDRSPGAHGMAYVAVQYACILALWAAWVAAPLSPPALSIAVNLYIVYALCCISAVMDLRRSARLLEASRLLIQPVAVHAVSVYAAGASSSLAIALTCAAAAVSVAVAAWLAWLTHPYDAWVREPHVWPATHRAAAASSPPLLPTDKQPLIAASAPDQAVQ